jgi:cephalosporin-C deacetylase-like acetyl esterase
MPYLYALMLLLTAAAMPAANLKIPLVDGAVVVDGRLDEPLWRAARSLSLSSPDFGPAFPAGGDAKAAVCGDHLCLGARLPESGRIIAMSQARSPTWWREDMLIWTFAVNFNNRGRRVTLTVNPLGAYALDSTLPDPNVMNGAMVTAQVSANEWTVEAAVPLERLASSGFLSIERVRVPRPDAPELRWQWPAPNERMDFELAGSASRTSAAPVFQPARVPGVNKESRAFPGLAAELAALPGRIWSEEVSAKQEAALESNLRKRMTDAAVAERLEWQKVKSRGDWEKFRDQRIAALRNSLGPFPNRTPLRAAVTRRSDYGHGFVIENVVYESMPGRLVPANLYLPSGSSANIPAIVVVHSHHAPKTQSELQDMGMTWARAGVAVLVPDQPGAGERIESQAWPRESYYARYALGMQLYLAGESLMKWMVWDLMRGIDLLLERRQIDPKRIVMLGAVAGGGDPAAVTAALDSRIAAVIPFNFGEAGPEEHYTEGPRPYDFETADPGWGYWESTRNLRLSASGQFFPWLICASVAPRPFLYAFEIGWPKTVEEEPAWARYKRVFDLYGQRENLAAVDGFGPFPGPGECTNVGSFLRRRIYPVLKKWLDMPIPASEYHSVKPDADLMAITPGIAAERKPKTTAQLASALAHERLKRARENVSALRPALAAKLGDIEPAKNPVATAVASKPLSRFSMEWVSVNSEPSVTLPIILFKPGGARVPAVLAMAQEGKSGFLANRGPEIAKLLEQGFAVCLFDVRGTGELTRRAARGPGAMSMAANELMLANTLLGARLKDARTVFRYLASRPDIDPKKIALWGDSFGAVNPREMLFDKSMNQPGGPEIAQAEPLGSLLALMTALYEPDAAAVVARRGLVSFLSVLDDRFLYVPLDVIVPGILEVGDLPDIGAAIAPRPVLMQAPVDGRNRPLALDDMTRKAAPLSSNTTLREDPDPGIVAAWISERLR